MSPKFKNEIIQNDCEYVFFMTLPNSSIQTSKPILTKFPFNMFEPNMHGTKIIMNFFENKHKSSKESKKWVLNKKNT